MYQVIQINIVAVQMMLLQGNLNIIPILIKSVLNNSKLLVFKITLNEKGYN